MSNPENQLLEFFREAFLQADRSGSRLQALSPLLAWFQQRSGGQRAFLISSRDDGGYRVWCSRDADGRKISKAAESISHHAFELGCNEKGHTFFSDVHLDRRFRAASETKGVTRSRWILVIPISIEGDPTALYLDSKFDSFDSSILDDMDVNVVRACIDMVMDIELSRSRESDVKSASSRSDSIQKKQAPIVEVLPERIESRIGDFITQSGTLKDAIAELKKIAVTKIPVLVEGESGTGKELLAKAIHQHSECDGPIVALHCGSVTESLIEVELFGYEKGAFTDAATEKAGLIESASGGTLLLDAIDESSMALQLSLLRFLESGSYRRVSGEEERTADVRIIACSSTKGKHAGIREELYYRLAGFQVWLPPLRERPIDALWIIEKILSGDEQKQPLLEAEAQALILSHGWPGNGWEATHLAQRILVSNHQTVDGPKVLELLGVLNSGEIASDPGVREVLGLAEREVIVRALEVADGNKSIACKTLGISRRTLYRRMRKYGIPLAGSDRYDS
ncbi:MAG: sigma 54-interacting transcriptional regulator [Planctomycetota bacterium]|nr:sigma 54-interacting transcriptional regulator [Planctomycetota bacterium]